MSGNLTAYAGAAATEGLSSAMDYERERPVRDMRLQEAKLKLTRAKEEAADYTKDQPIRDAERDQKLTAMQESVYKTQRDFAARRTYDAFNQYNADGDTKHLNNFLKFAKTDPSMGSIYEHIVRVDTLQASDRTKVTQLLTQAGFTKPEDVIDSPELSKDFTIATDTNGELALVSMSQLYAGTGYTNEMTTRDLAIQEERVKITNLLKGPQSSETQLIHDIADQLRAKGDKDPLINAYKLYKDTGSKGGSTVERLAKRLMDGDPNLKLEDATKKATNLLATGTADEREAYRVSAEQGIDFQQAYQQVTNRTERTNTQKNTDASFDVRDKLDALSPDKDFFKLDMKDVNNRRKAQPYITQLQQLTGQTLSTEDQRMARNIRDLISLGGAAGSQLTPGETDLVDSMFSNVKKYMTQEGGKTGTAAYETFRNVLRNSLYGASLTGSEINSFQAAAGSLKQQLGPVLNQLNVQLSSLKSQLSAIYDYNDEYVSHFYLGQDRDQLDKVIAALEQRIELVQSAGGSSKNRKVPIKKVAKPTAPTMDDAAAMDRLKQLQEGK